MDRTSPNVFQTFVLGDFKFWLRLVNIWGLLTHHLGAMFPCVCVGAKCPGLSSLGARPGLTGAGSQRPAQISPHFRQFPTFRCLVKVAANTRYFIYNINYQWRVVDPNLISVRIPKFIFDFKLWLRLRLSIREALKNHLRFDICLTKSGFLWGFP